jgi:hypothetical protein
MIDMDLLKEISDENKILREALAYYADPANWQSKANIARLDRGETARQVLRGGNEQI